MVLEIPKCHFVLCINHVGNSDMYDMGICKYDREQFKNSLGIFMVMVMYAGVFCSGGGTGKESKIHSFDNNNRLENQRKSE